jgi:hypothetical protein
MHVPMSSLVRQDYAKFVSIIRQNRASDCAGCSHYKKPKSAKEDDTILACHSHWKPKKNHPCGQFRRR